MKWKRVPRNSRAVANINEDKSPTQIKNEYELREECRKRNKSAASKGEETRYSVYRQSIVKDKRQNKS